MKRAQQDAPWQPLYNTEHTAEHLRYDQITAIEWMTELGYGSSHWVHKLLLSDLVAEYGVTEENSALNLIYLLGWNSHNSGGLPLAGTDERLHVVGGNDKVIKGMANELPNGTIKEGHKLEAVTRTSDDKRYKLSFDNGPDETCDVLVMALPLGLVKYVDFSAGIWGSFSPQKQMAILNATTADNGKIQMEFSDRYWDKERKIHGRLIHQAARAYSDPDKFISTWEGNPGSTSEKGILVNYTGGADARKMFGKTILGEADWKDVRRVMPQFEQIWPGITDQYTGKALVSNWWENPYSLGAFTSPTINTMTTWWGAQWEPEGNMYFAGEAYDHEVWSYMEGAIRSGERAATAIHQNY
jgi:monoamine oxidase